MSSRIRPLLGLLLVGASLLLVLVLREEGGRAELVVADAHEAEPAPAPALAIRAAPPPAREPSVAPAASPRAEARWIQTGA